MSLVAARYVFAISASTKEEIVRHYPAQKDKVVVTQLAYDSAVFNARTKAHEQFKLKRLKAEFSIGPDYILYLGVIKPSKNVGALVAAWQDCKQVPQICPCYRRKEELGL